MAKRTKDDFYLGTRAVFSFTTRPDRDPDYVSESGSEYWYSEEGVVRGSGHWGARVATCQWYIGCLADIGLFGTHASMSTMSAIFDYSGEALYGFCSWGAFGGTGMGAYEEFQMHKAAA